MAAVIQQVEDDEWPLVVLRPAAVPTRASLEALDQDLCDVLAEGRRICLLADLRHKSCIDLEEAKQLAMLFHTQGPRIEALVLALAVIAPAAMVRGGLRVVFGHRPPKIPIAVFRTRPEASAFIGPYLAELTTSVGTCMTRLAAVGQ